MPGTAVSQVLTTNHGAGVFKNVVGPIGISVAYPGETATYAVRVSHADGVFSNGVPFSARDTLTITSIVDIIHLPGGDLFHTNYFSTTGITLSNLFDTRFGPALAGSFIQVSSNYVVPLNAGNIITNDAIVDGFDNHDFAGGTGVRQAFRLTFPAQLSVLKPRICLTKSCLNATGETGLVTFSGSVSNCGNSVLNNVVVSNLVNGQFLHVLGPTTLAVNQSISFTGSYTNPNPCAPVSDTLYGWGTDILGLVTNATATATCSNILNPSLVVTKACPVTNVAPGQLLRFTGSVSNSGNVTLANVVVVNDRPAPNTAVTNITLLAPGQVATFTGSYLAPSNVCFLRDTLTARGTTACGVSTTNTTFRDCPITSTPAIQITKLCPNGQSLPGTMLTFTGRVQNVGNIALTNVVVINDRPAPNTVVTNIASLPIGATVIITGSYLVPTNYPDCMIMDTLIARAASICDPTLVSSTNTASCLVRGGTLTITCPTNITVQCLADVPPPNTNSVIINSGAGGVNVTFCGAVTNTTGCVAVITRTYCATDACSNMMSCTQTITVRDTIPPVLVGVPAGTNVQCLANLPILPTVTATDNCDTNVTVTRQSTTNGTCPIIIVHTWTATDDCTNITTASITNTVRDTIPPVLAGVPTNVTVQCLNNVPAPPPVTANDNCDGTVPVTFSAVTNGSCPLLITRMWMATDRCSNAVTAIQTVTVRDTVPPTLVGVPTNVTVQCLANVLPPPGVTGADNCDTNVQVTLNVTTNGSCPLVITRTWTAVDDCTNSASATQIITVRDTIPPVFTNAPTNMTFQCLANVPAAPAVGASDNCDTNVQVTLNITTNGSCPLTITRVWTALDDCTNSATAIQVITVRDTIPPVLAGVPTNRVFECLSDVPAPPTVTATDNCDTNVPVTLVSVTNGSCPILIVRTWTATDRCTNGAVGVQVIRVQDTTPPTLIGVPAGTNVQCLANVPPPPAVTATDNCDLTLPITFTAVTNGSCPIIIIRTWTVFDDCTNSASASQVITVRDLTPPTLAGVPTNQNFQCLSQVPAPPAVTANDNCDGALPVTLISTTNGTCPILIVRTWTAIDRCTNSVAAVQTITVRDTVPPVFTNPPPNLVFQCLSNVTAPPAVGASDNCDTNVTITFMAATNGLCPTIITRTWTAVDDCTNTAQIIQIVTVRDTNAPVLVGLPPNRTFNCPAELPAPPAVTATDNCDPSVPVTFTATTNGFRPTIVVWCWQAVDDCNNIVSACRTNTILDVPAALGDFVWNDLNRNGLQDGGEPGISNVTVRLYTCATSLVATTTTDANGRYLFTGLVPGSYFAEFVPPLNFSFTTPNVGANDNIDSDAVPATGRTACVPLVCAQTNTTVDAGLIQPACLGDFVWEDINGNGLQDAGEPGITNVTLILRNCTNNAVVATTNTTVNGFYLFCDLAPGQYRVEIIVPAGYNITVPNSGTNDCVDSDADPVTRLTDCVTLPPGGDNRCVDIGLKRPAALGDFVWEDLNFNGLQDPGEPGVSNVTVILFNCASQAIATNTTDANGLYLFTNLMPSNYVVRFVPPSGYLFTQPNIGGVPNDCIDSDAVAGGNSQCVTLLSGETNRCVDAGLIRPPCLGDFVWEDINGNGIQDAGEPGITNVTVRLIDCGSNGVVSATVTGTNGFYLLCSTYPGTFRVEVVTNAGFTITVPNSGTNDCVDSDANPGTRLTDCVVLPSGTTNRCVDIGLKKPAALGDFVWEDLNFNGLQDAGEPGVSNVTVQLYNCSGQLITSQQTGPGGLYLFTNLMPSNYVVRFVLPPGYAFTLPNVGSNTNIDSDAGAGGNSACVVLNSGVTNRTVDAGLIRPPCLGDFVWEDINGNGIQDAGEPGVTNVTVRLIDCGSNGVVSTTVTGTNGYYLLCSPYPGTFRVEIVTPGGYTITVPNSGTNDCVDSDANPGTRLTDCVVLPSGTTNLCVDIGLKKPAALGDFVWEDLNYNGLQDAGEPGVPNVTVILFNCASQPIATNMTDANGLYLFTNLMPSNYVVRFIPPAGWLFTLPNVGGVPNDCIDSDAAGGGNSQCVTLTSGETNRCVDAGLIRPACLGDFVWEDRNRNGLQDAGEPGVTNVMLILRECASGTALATNFTGPNGQYLFCGLLPGSYKVEIIVPGGYTITTNDVPPDNCRDSDANTVTRLTECATLVSGETNRCTDIGLLPPDERICVTKLVACYLPGGQCGPFGKTATGVKGGTNLPAFCYSITISNCGGVALTNLSVVDQPLGNLTSFYSPSVPLAPGESRTFTFLADWDKDTTNRVVASGKSTFAAAGSQPRTVTATDEAVAYVEEARIACTVTLFSPADDIGGGNTTNDALVRLPRDGFLHPVTVTVMVMNIGDVDLDNITFSGSVLAQLGCTNPPVLPFPLPAGMAAKVTLCQTRIGCDDFDIIPITVTAQASTNGGLCIYGTNGQPVRVSTACEGEVTCREGGNCRVTGGGRQEQYFPADVRYVTHGGQVGAPVGNEGFDPGTFEREGSECIHGNWQHVRHQKGGNRGNFHAKIYDSLMCACLACPEDPNSGFVIGGLCNPGARICGPEPRRAPANKITFSGIGDYTTTSGNREPRAVLFRVDIEDRSEPGNSHAGGNKPPPDRHRIRIWILTDAEVARLKNPLDRLLDFREAISASPVNTPLEDGAVGLDGRFVPLGTAVFGVRPPDIDDGGEMNHGNHQIHPSIKDCP